MSEVVASEQLKKAAQYKGDAAYIQAVREAEAEKERKRHRVKVLRRARSHSHGFAPIC